jgi:hypothetical protein
MQKLIAFAVVTAFLGAGSFTIVASPASAQDKKETVSVCDRIKSASVKAACMEREAKRAADKAKRDEMKSKLKTKK